MHPYKNLLDQFREYLEKVKPTGAPEELYAPISYIMGLGGKRMRPLLVLAGCDLFNGPVESALPVAYAMELFHNFSLVHDDIMDNAPLRRGQPTVHVKYSPNTAILSGDAMLVYAYERLIGTPTDKVLTLLKVFNDTAIKVCEGQQLDMNFETRDDVTVDEYIAMITYKTAVLLGCCLQCGAIMGGADEENAAKLYQYGLHMGIAFQLQDDLLDAFGSAEFGKEIGGDIRQNKKTYLLIKALELAMDDDKALLEYQLQHQTDLVEKVRLVTELYKKLSINDLAENLMQEHYRKALKLLDSVSADPAKKQLLKDFAGELLVRTV